MELDSELETSRLSSSLEQRSSSASSSTCGASTSPPIPTTIAAIDPGRTNVGIVVYDYVAKRTIFSQTVAISPLNDKKIKHADIAQLTVENIVQEPWFQVVLSAETIVIEEQVPYKGPMMALRMSLDKNIRMSEALKGVLHYLHGNVLTVRPWIVQNHFVRQNEYMPRAIALWGKGGKKWTAAFMKDIMGGRTGSDHEADCFMMICYLIEKNGLGYGLPGPLSWPTKNGFE